MHSEITNDVAVKVFDTVNANFYRKMLLAIVERFNKEGLPIVNPDIIAAGLKERFPTLKQFRSQALGR